MKGKEKAKDIMLKEFKDFAIKGNMLDMAVGEIPLEATRCRCCTSELE